MQAFLNPGRIQEILLVKSLRTSTETITPPDACLFHKAMHKQECEAANEPLFQTQQRQLIFLPVPPPQRSWGRAGCQGMLGITYKARLKQSTTHCSLILNIQ